ncbi:hypothetical protein L0F63_006326 [Massospora cicadina]|nr:hypothetical protein L0F63_006326 [Massospora cicadina]
MIHTYEQTLQILYRHLHSALSRQSLSKLTGQTVAINGSSILRNLILKPNILLSPEQGLPKNRHLQGFYEIGRYLKNNKVTPLFVFENTEKLKGYGTEQQRRYYLKDHGTQGLKFELEKQVNLSKLETIFKSYYELTMEEHEKNLALYKKAHDEQLNIEDLLQEENRNPSVDPKYLEMLTQSPHAFVALAVDRLLTPHETGGEHCRNHLQRMGVQYERKVKELYERLNIPEVNGSIPFDLDVLEYIQHNIKKALIISDASINILKVQLEDWDKKEEQVLQLLKLLNLPVAYTETNSADAICASLLGSDKCNYAITDNPFILGYRVQQPNKNVMFNFMSPYRHLLSVDLGKVLTSLTVDLPQLRDYLFLCDTDTSQGFRGLEPDIILQALKKHKSIEKVRLMFPNMVCANFDPERARNFFDQEIQIPTELNKPYTFLSDSVDLVSFLEKNCIDPNPTYTYFKAPATAPSEFIPQPINTNPKILCKIGTHEPSKTRFPAFNNDDSGARRFSRGGDSKSEDCGPRPEHDAYRSEGQKSKPERDNTQSNGRGSKSGCSSSRSNSWRSKPERNV